MDNFIIIAVVTVIVGVALAYVIKAKKKGGYCILKIDENYIPPEIEVYFYAKTNYN